MIYWFQILLSKWVKLYRYAAVWEMEEILYALGPYAAGLNAARWDLKVGGCTS